MAALRIGRLLLNSFEARLFCPALSSLPGKSYSSRYFHVGVQRNIERKFTKEHEWVTLSDKVGTVGITDHAQQQLGDVVYVELPDIGAEMEQNDIFGVVESVKAASDLYLPVGGEIVEVNELLQEQPELLNKEPYDGGWIIKLKLSDLTQWDDLMDESAYEKFVSESGEND